MTHSMSYLSIFQKRKEHMQDKLPALPRSPRMNQVRKRNTSPFKNVFSG